MKWFSVQDRSEMPFQLYIGGRGIGKTYSALDLVRNLPLDRRFLYMRLTDKELKSATSARVGANPFRKLNEDMCDTIECDYSDGDGFAIFERSTVEQVTRIGYGASLSTFAGLRGIDYSDVDVIIMEECVAEIHRNRMRAKGIAFLNMYETVNRNRELNGQPPVRVYMLCNSITQDDDLLATLGISKILEHMQSTGQTRHTDRERALYVEIVGECEVTEAKRKTALYRLAGDDSEFTKQALQNEFVNDAVHRVRKVSYSEYIPTFEYCGYTVYSHKANGTLHIAKKSERINKKYNDTQRDALRRSFGVTYRNLLEMNGITFDSYATNIFFNNALNYKRKK